LPKLFIFTDKKNILPVAHHEAHKCSSFFHYQEILKMEMNGIYHGSKP
jgi:predicted NodU family carbamoyl transferase